VLGCWEQELATRMLIKKRINGGEPGEDLCGDPPGNHSGVVETVSRRAWENSQRLVTTTHKVDSITGRKGA